MFISNSNSPIRPLHSIYSAVTNSELCSSQTALPQVALSLANSTPISSTSPKRNSTPEGRLEEGKTATDSLPFHPSVESDCATRIAILRKAALDSMRSLRRPADGETDPNLEPPLKRRIEGHTDRSDFSYASKAALCLLKSDSQKRDSNDSQKVAHSEDYRSCDTAYSSCSSSREAGSREAEPGYLPGSSRLPDNSRSSSRSIEHVRINQSICSAARRRSIEDIESIYYRNIEDLDGANTAIAFHRIAQITKTTRKKPSEEFIASLIDRSLDLIGEFNPQNLSNIAWALATLRFHDDRLIKALALAAVDQIAEFKPQELSITAWAFAKLGICNDRLMKALALAAEDQIQKFKPQELSNTAWAFATLNLCESSLLRAIALTAINQIRAFKPQELSNIAWAFSKLSIHNGPLMQALALAAERRIHGFKPQELSTTAWAFASLEVYNDPLMRALALAARDQIQRFNPQDITNMAWAFASLGARDADLMKTLALAAVGQIGKFTPQGLANIAWAFALLENESSPLFRSIAKVMENQSPHIFNPRDIRQLLQAQSALKLHGVDFSLIPSHWNLVAPVEHYRISELQRGVGSCLKAMAELRGGELKAEHFIPEIGHSIDFTMGAFAFEVDGPFHFAFESDRLLGSALFRNRLLKQLGWRLVCIPYWEWEGLDTTEKQRSYLNQKIEEVLKCELSSTTKPSSSN